MIKRGSRRKHELAGIEYMGISGASRDCQNAVLRLLQFGDNVIRARILSCSNTHCLLLTINTHDLVAVKSGFSSGYGGEGPRRFSYVLELLIHYGSDIEEYEVDDGLIERVDSAALTVEDIEQLERARPVRPGRWGDYIVSTYARDGTLWTEFPPVVPFAIIDPRLVDLALGFKKGQDHVLLTGYRRLEDTIRERAAIDEHGAKLFSRAFGGSVPPLVWTGIDEGERTGRINLFTGAYMTHRNPRAHSEVKDRPHEQLAEFLLLNHLFLLESRAKRRS